MLVSTTVVEVGVDVPNASVMLVEHAERFGLSQLHQLRGRVGRGRATVVLHPAVPGPLTEQGRARLKALTETTDGFGIAERDLELRGPGDFFGTRQSGMPTLRVGDLVRDHQLMEDARREAVAALDDARQAATLAAFVRTSWEQRFGLVGMGERQLHASSADSAGDLLWAGTLAAELSGVADENNRRHLKGRRLKPPSGTGCGRRPTSCAKRCSTCWRPRSTGARCWTAMRARGGGNRGAQPRGGARDVRRAGIRARPRSSKRTSSTAASASAMLLSA